MVQLTKLQRLIAARDLLNELVDLAQRKAYSARNSYEIKKVNNQCAAKKSCKDQVVLGKTLCRKHLLKAAQAAHRYWRKKKCR